MGFSIEAKANIASRLLPDDIIGSRHIEIGDEVLSYLRNQNLLRLVRDYAIIPKGLHKTKKTENITVIKFFSQDFDLYNYLSEMLSDISLPFRFKMDFNFLIFNPLESNIEDKYRYVWAQRSTCLTLKDSMTNSQDVEELLDTIKSMTYSDLLITTYENHMNQSAFDKSGYNPHSLLTLVCYLSKFAE